MNRLTQHKSSQNVLMRLHTIYSSKYLNMKLLTILGAITTPFQIRKSNPRPHDNRRHKAGTHCRHKAGTHRLHKAEANNHHKDGAKMPMSHRL